MDSYPKNPFCEGCQGKTPPIDHQGHKTVQIPDIPIIPGTVEV